MKRYRFPINERERMYRQSVTSILKSNHHHHISRFATQVTHNKLIGHHRPVCKFRKMAISSASYIKMHTCKYKPCRGSVLVHTNGLPKRPLPLGLTVYAAAILQASCQTDT